jgi:hypothetical protein
VARLTLLHHKPHTVCEQCCTKSTPSALASFRHACHSCSSSTGCKRLCIAHLLGASPACMHACRLDLKQSGLPLHWPTGDGWPTLQGLRCVTCTGMLVVFCRCSLSTAGHGMMLHGKEHAILLYCRGLTLSAVMRCGEGEYRLAAVLVSFRLLAD